MSASTPRTDEAEWEAVDERSMERSRFKVVNSEVARQLERELAEARKDIAALERNYQSCLDANRDLLKAPQPEVQPSMALVKEHKLARLGLSDHAGQPAA
jgi:hypothetical protein